MKRAVAVLCCGLVTSLPSLAAADDLALRPGTRVRIRKGQSLPPDDRDRAAHDYLPAFLIGRFVRSDERSILVDWEGKGTVRVPRASISALEMSLGTRGHALAGLKIGTAVGGVAVLGLLRSIDEAGGGLSSKEYVVGALIGAAAVGSIGTLIGAASRGDRWVCVYSGNARSVNLGASSSGLGAALTVSW